MTIRVGQPIDRRGLTYTSRYIGTHKNLLRLVICPIYSVVKVRPRKKVVGRLSLVVRPTTLINNIFLTRLSGYGSSLSVFAFNSKKTKSNTTCWSTSNPMFGVKATFF